MTVSGQFSCPPAGSFVAVSGQFLVTADTGGGGEFSGAGVWRSGDGGRTWSLTQLTSGQMDEWAANDPEFAAQIGWSETPKPFGDRFGQVWSLGRAGDRLYAGTKPALLLVSGAAICTMMAGKRKNYGK